MAVENGRWTASIVKSSLSLAGEVLHPPGYRLRLAWSESGFSDGVVHGNIDSRWDTVLIWLWLFSPSRRSRRDAGFISRLRYPVLGTCFPMVPPIKRPVPRPSIPCVMSLYRRLPLGKPTHARLPAPPRQTSIKPINPPEHHRYRVLLVADMFATRHLHFRRALSTQGGLIDLSPLVPPPTRVKPAAGAAVPVSLLNTTTTIIIKEFPDRRPLDNPPAPTYQTPVTGPVPEAPAQAHALVPAEHDLAAHLADREVEERVVAGLAGEPGAAADDPARRGLGALGPPAEGTEIGFRAC